MDRKAEKATEHAEQLRRDRKTLLDKKINCSHLVIDRCTDEMRECFVVFFIGCVKLFVFYIHR